MAFMSNNGAMTRENDINAQIIEDLYTKGWSVQTEYFTPNLSDTLLNRLNKLDEQDSLTKAGVGRHENNQLSPDIRKDRTFWLESENKDDALYLKLMENLREALNQSLFLGLFEYEAHYALYSPGGYYKKHVDAFKGEKNRLVSTVCYLNKNWVPENGGQLDLFDKEDANKHIHRVEPKMGTLVVFLSEEIPHEVTTSNIDRKSIAGWFRCNNSSNGKTDPLR